MEKNNLSTIMNDKVFEIPDYQRGYAWEEKQIKDFIQDIDAIVEDSNIKSHYTGTIVTYIPNDRHKVNYGVEKYDVYEVVDGQQRLTTSVLYLSLIINELLKNDKKSYEKFIEKYLYSGVVPKLKLNNDTNDFFIDIISKGEANSKDDSIHKKNILFAYKYFKKHLKNKKNSYEEYNKYLSELFDTITKKLNFTTYTIEEECEIGMTFELMNSRGKELSIMELLKNYLMYWISKNGSKTERESITAIINKTWKNVYTNISSCNGNEDQCLRISWILLCNHLPKNWKGYEGFKEDEYIPIRNFEKKNKETTLQFIKDFIKNLETISKKYAEVLNKQGTKEESKYLCKIINTDNIANFLPIIISAKIHFINEKITEENYLEILKKFEIFAYRVFLTEGKRSNAGQSSFYKWGKEIFEGIKTIEQTAKDINDLILWYSPEEKFQRDTKLIQNWYARRRVLRYTLFEYENYLLESEGKNQTTRLQWKDINDSTIEHILPQKVKDDSHWNEVWTFDEREIFTHDLSNLVLTVNNSNYYNFDFSRKKGNLGEGFCYSNSDIRQERKIAVYDDWTKESCLHRRSELEDWIINKWGNIQKLNNVEIDTENINDEEENETIQS